MFLAALGQEAALGRPDPELRRRLGFYDTLATALGAIIGAGIFVVLGQAAGTAGAALPIAVLIAALVATVNGLSAAELGVIYPHAGGGYEFGYECLSPVAGFIAGWLYLLSYLIASPAITLSFAGYLQPLVPGLPPRVVAVGIAALALAVNVAGVQQSRLVNDLLVAFKVAVLGLFVLVGLASFGLWEGDHFASLPVSGIPPASALLFFAFVGFAQPVVIAGEVRHPARNLPRAIVAALGISTVLYLAVAIVGLGLVGPQVLASSTAPLRTALVPTGQPWAELLVVLGGLVATTDVLLNSIWGLSRLTFAMAERGDLPTALAQVDRRGTPRHAVLAIGALILPLTATVAFGPALAASSLSQLVYYGLIDAAALRLSAPQRLYPAAAPAVGILTCAALAVSLPAQSLLIVSGTVAVGLAYYVWWRRRHRRAP